MNGVPLREMTGIKDEILVVSGLVRPLESDIMALIGHGAFVHADRHGRVLTQGLFKNLITDVGDEFYAKKGGEGTINNVSGFRLGTGGATAPAKNGAGAAIVTYVSGSSKIEDSITPSSLGAGAGWRIAYVITYAAGEATATGIDETVITNEQPLTDVAGAAANTISRGILSPSVNKGASDTLVITWNHDFQGT